MGTPAQPPESEGHVPPPPPVSASAPVAGPAQQEASAQDIDLNGDRTLIVRKGAVLPPVCIVTGRTDNLVKRTGTASWAPCWVYLPFIIFFLIPCGAPIAAVIYLIVKKNIRFEYYLEKATAKKRSWVIVGNWMLFLIPFLGMLSVLEHHPDIAMCMTLGGIVLLIIVYFAFINLYSVAKIDNGHAWLTFRNPAIARAIYDAYRNRPDVYQV